MGDSYALFNLIGLPFEAVYRIFGEVNGEGPPIGDVDTWAIFAALVGLIAAFERSPAGATSELR